MVSTDEITGTFSDVLLIKEKAIAGVSSALLPSPVSSAYEIESMTTGNDAGYTLHQCLPDDHAQASTMHEWNARLLNGHSSSQRQTMPMHEDRNARLLNGRSALTLFCDMSSPKPASDHLDIRCANRWHQQEQDELSTETATDQLSIAYGDERVDRARRNRCQTNGDAATDEVLLTETTSPPAATQRLLLQARQARAFDTATFGTTILLPSRRIDRVDYGGVSTSFALVHAAVGLSRAEDVRLSGHSFNGDRLPTNVDELKSTWEGAFKMGNAMLMMNEHESSGDSSERGPSRGMSFGDSYRRDEIWPEVTDFNRVLSKYGKLDLDDTITCANSAKAYARHTVLSKHGDKSPWTAVGAPGQVLSNFGQPFITTEKGFKASVTSDFNAASTSVLTSRTRDALSEQHNTELGNDRVIPGNDGNSLNVSDSNNDNDNSIKRVTAHEQNVMSTSEATLEEASVLGSTMMAVIFGKSTVLAGQGMMLHGADTVLTPNSQAIGMQRSTSSSVVTTSVGSTFQIRFRGISGRTETLDDVCGDDYAGEVLVRILNKIGISEQHISRLSLRHDGKKLDPSAPCNLDKGDTVQLAGSFLVGGSKRNKSKLGGSFRPKSDGSSSSSYPEEVKWDDLPPLDGFLTTNAQVQLKEWTSAYVKEQEAKAHAEAAANGDVEPVGENTAAHRRVVKYRAREAYSAARDEARSKGEELRTALSAESNGRDGWKWRELVLQVLQGHQQPPHALEFDVGYDAWTKQFWFRSPQGKVQSKHPAEADSELLQLCDKVAQPLQPTVGSPWVLAPNSHGGWCYINVNSGETKWEAPSGSRRLQTRHLVERDFPDLRTLPELSRFPVNFKPFSNTFLKDTGWRAHRMAARQLIHFTNATTLAHREGPWISLLTDDGTDYFANLTTLQLRWFPPHNWMRDWVDRGWRYGRMFDQRQGIDGKELCDVWSRNGTINNDAFVSFHRYSVAGGAPYLEDTGLPPWKPDAKDTPRTHAKLERQMLKMTERWMARSIQVAVQRYLSRKRSYRLRTDGAAMRLQAAVRGNLQRQWFRHYRSHTTGATVSIQAVVRGTLQRLRFRSQLRGSGSWLHDDDPELTLVTTPLGFARM